MVIRSRSSDFPRIPLSHGGGPTLNMRYNAKSICAAALTKSFKSYTLNALETLNPKTPKTFDSQPNPLNANTPYHQPKMKVPSKLVPLGVESQMP